MHWFHHLLAALATPLASLWVRYQESVILRYGQPLTPEQAADAERAGVRDVAQVRIRVVDTVPTPVPGFLQEVIGRLGWPTQGIAGMALGYGIHLHPRYAQSRSVLLHELTHVAQYERLGGIPFFLHAYVQECLVDGYPHGPLEQEAIAVQQRWAPWA